MAEFISENRDLIDAISQLLLVVIPVIITWYIRTYVQGSKAEKDVAASVRLANIAIDYAENLDKRGDLNVPHDLSRGLAKLKEASRWLEEELAKANINRIYLIELVNFGPNGITFHMSRFPGGGVALAPECMFEIKEIMSVV